MSPLPLPLIARPRLLTRMAAVRGHRAALLLAPPGMPRRRYGMDNLWVADASIMPTVTHANTNLTCIMIGERLADFLKEL